MESVPQTHITVNCCNMGSSYLTTYETIEGRKVYCLRVAYRDRKPVLTIIKHCPWCGTTDFTPGPAVDKGLLSTINQPGARVAAQIQTLADGPPEAGAGVPAQPEPGDGGWRKLYERVEEQERRLTALEERLWLWQSV